MSDETGPTAGPVWGDEARRTQFVLLSDVHLTQVREPSIPGWWEYKHPIASQDAELLDFVAFVDAQRPPRYRCTHLVFNGDTWDFDSVYGGPDGPMTPAEGLPPTMPGSLWKLRRLIADHEEFTHGLAAFLARGNGVTFIMGNHDRELAFPEVQEAMRQELARRAPPGTASIVAAAVRFEPWFLYVPGVLYVEHGQQYDATCSYRDVLHPFIGADRRSPMQLDASLGSVIGRQVLSRLGSFNPFDDDSFLQSLTGYARHAMEHYWPRRAFLTVYVRLAFRVLRIMLTQRHRALATAPDSSEAYRAYARRKGLGMDFIALLRRLGSKPIADRLRALVHELWIDRLVISAVAVTIVVLGIVNAEHWTQSILMLGLFPPLVFVLRAMGRGSLALQERGRWGLVAEQISAHLDVPVVCFGHSHRPERRPLRNGGRYYNLGTWAPVPDPERQAGLLRARRYLIVRHAGPGRTFVAFQRWGGDGSGPI